MLPYTRTVPSKVCAARVIRYDICIGDNRLTSLPQVVLTTSDGKELSVDHIVVAVGIAPSTELASESGLELDTEHGGFRVDAELRARSDVWVRF